MFVNETIIRATEQRIAAKGFDRFLVDGRRAPMAMKVLGITAAPDMGGLGAPFDRDPTNRPTPAQIEKRVAHATFAGGVPSKAELERYIGTNDLVDENYLERALVAAHPVCRLVFRDIDSGRPAYATGFMIAPQLLLTNWHVFPLKRAAEGAVAEFNYKLDIKGLELTPVRFDVRPDLYFTSDQDLDYALVALAQTSTDGATPLSTFGYHRLVAQTGKLAKDEPITLIQHPNGGYRQIALRENQLLEDPQPGDLFLLYSSDTAQGSSGSPAFNDSWQVVALHHSGKARQENGQYILRDGTPVRSLNGVADSDIDWIANEGVRTSVLCDALRHLGNAAIEEQLIAAMDGNGDIMSRSIGGQESMPKDSGDTLPTSTRRVSAPTSLLAGAQGLGLHAAQVNIAHQIIVQSLPAQPAPVARAALPDARPKVLQDQALPEKLVTPVIDPKYSNRKGYDEAFIGLRVPLPAVTDKKIVSKMANGEFVIPYEHFSIVMNKERRLASFTASNVDAGARSRKPDPAADYTRKGLTGLAKNDQEKWFTDPRIPEQHQLPDVFYNKDRQAFDKGHIVRRDDVCWGGTYAQLRRANGDTFHTTNCSPQVADFNRSASGGKWGELENMILKQAKTEKLAIFAGPIFQDDDDVFEGVDDRGPISVPVPRRFWKIVFANNGGSLEAYPFILEQDLSRVALEPEFAVGADWVPYVISTKKLEAMLAGFMFDATVHAADQSAAEHGNELAVTAEIRKV